MSSVIRILDIVLSLIGLMALVFFLPAIWILIRMDSKGPLFYIAERVGKDMKKFGMYKFRTMLETPVPVGECLCPQFDPRVTSVGRILRSSKINELPQLINILKGDMSFVGPRPESPELAEIYPDEAQTVFLIKPGLVGPASIRGRNEEENYPIGVDVKQYYLENLLANKVQLDMEYILNPNLVNYLKFVFLGIKATISGLMNKRQIASNQPQIYLLIADVLLITGAYLAAYNFCVWYMTGDLEIVHSTRLLPIVILVRLLCNQYFGLYSPLLRFISFHDIIDSFKSTACGTVVLFLISALLEKNSYSLFIAILDWTGMNLSAAGLRFVLMIYFQDTKLEGLGKKKLRVLIYGACSEGNNACRALISDSDMPYEVIGFIDDDVDKYNKTLNGKRVLGNRHHIKDLAKLYNIDQVLVSEAQIEQRDLIEIVALCGLSGVKCGIFSGAKGFNGDNGSAAPIRNVELSDVLSLKDIHADYVEVEKIIRDKTILMNGSGGAMGMELCRRLIKLGCKKLVIAERYESYLNELIGALFNDHCQDIIFPVLFDPENLDSLEKVFAAHRPNIVIQAGLRKYPPFLGLEVANLEDINYTRNFRLAKLASKYRCNAFIMISSIAAKERRNAIDVSLRIAEDSLGHFFHETQTRLIIVRLCNIAESRGGIVSIIEEQVKRRETVTLFPEHDNVSIISKNSAAEFILKALVDANKDLSKNRLFVYETEMPVPLMEIVRKLASLYNLKLTNETPFLHSN